MVSLLEFLSAQFLLIFDLKGEWQLYVPKTAVKTCNT